MSESTTTSNFRAHLSYPAVLLGVAVLLASSLLGLGNAYTRDAIAERQREDLLASLDQVIPASFYDNELLSTARTLALEGGESLLVYRASREGIMTGFAYEVVAPDGYGGPIRILLGVDPLGQLLGVRVLSHAETPGLGDKVEITRSDWILSFGGLSLQFPEPDAWTVKKQGGHFDQFTGATITPRAVVRAVKRGLELFEQQRDVLFQKAQGDERPAAEIADQATSGGMS